MSGLHFRGDCKSIHESLRLLFDVAPSSDGELPVLKNILFKTDKKNRLHATSFDLSVGARVVMDCVEVLRPGKAMIEAFYLEDSMKELTGNILDFEFQHNFHCRMKAGDAKFTIPCQTPEDYPRVPRVKPVNTATLPAKTLKKMIYKTSYACHPDRGRWAINGVLVDLRDSRLRLVATDTKRLALAQYDLSDPVTNPMYAVVPTKAMEIFGKRMGEEGDAVLEISKNLIQLRSGQTSLFARLVVGEFPPYEQAVPRKLPRKMRFARPALSAGLRKVLMLGKSKKDTQVGMALKRNKLRLYRRSLDHGDSDVRVDIDYKGPEIILGCNADFLLQAVKLLEKPQARLSFENSSRPAVMRERDETGLKFTHLVMPMQVVPD